MQASCKHVHVGEGHDRWRRRLSQEGDASERAVCTVLNRVYSGRLVTRKIQVSVHTVFLLRLKFKGALGAAGERQ